MKKRTEALPARKVTHAAFFLPILWLLLIWTVSSLPARKLSAPRIVSLDKVAHIGEYLILGLLVNRAAKKLRLNAGSVTVIYLLLLLSAGLDEWHQVFIPQRSSNIWDYLANSTGLGIGYVMYRVSHDRSKEPVA